MPASMHVHTSIISVQLHNGPSHTKEPSRSVEAGWAGAGQAAGAGPSLLLQNVDNISINHLPARQAGSNRLGGARGPQFCVRR